MKATLITSRWASALLGGCRLAAEFISANADKLPNDRLREKAKSVCDSLDIYMQRESATVPFDEVSVLVLSAPGVMHGFIQQTAALDEVNVARVPGGAGAWIHGYVFRDVYRVFLHTGSKFYEAQNADLLTAIREAFERLDLPLPQGLM